MLEPNRIEHYQTDLVKIADYDAAFSAFEIENISLTKSQTTMDVGWMTLNGISIIQRKTESDVLQCGRSLDNAFTFFLPSANQQAIHDFVTNKYDDRSSFVVGPGEIDSRLLRGGNPNFALAFEKEGLSRVLSRVELEHLHEFGSAFNRRNIDPVQIQRCSQRLTDLVQLMNNGLIEQYDPGTLEQLFDSAVFNIAMLSDQAAPDILQARRSPLTLTKAIEFIKSHYFNPINVAQIADESHTTVRNLQYIFCRKLNMTPMQFLRCYRMFKFHANLGKYQTVKQAAIESGFTHFGRASQAYKGYFGVNPSSHLVAQTSNQFYGWLSHKKAKRYMM